MIVLGLVCRWKKNNWSENEREIFESLEFRMVGKARKRRSEMERIERQKAEWLTDFPAQQMVLFLAKLDDRGQHEFSKLSCSLKMI